MCEPTTLAVASLAMTAASTGMSAMGQMNAQAAQGAQASYLAQVERQRQAVARMQADDARKRGEVAVDRQRTVTSQRIGTQTAALAAQGTDMTGSEADILGDTAAAGELDASTLRANAAREAWGYEVGANNAGANAGLYDAFQPSNLGAGTSLLMGASSIADKWRRFQLPGGDAFGSTGWIGTSTRAPGTDGM
jgi:hypothetical protein